MAGDRYALQSQMTRVTGHDSFSHARLTKSNGMGKLCGTDASVNATRE